MTITIDRAVLEQMLEDVCGARLCGINSMSSRAEQERLMSNAITALREALNAPQPEPVAWINPDWPQNITSYAVNGFTPLYTAPPRREWVDLTDEQIDALWRAPMSADWEHREFARAIEQALKERNHD